jgi:regulator of sirC expression with transglutaminase-like and TPR domain
VIGVIGGYIPLRGWAGMQKGELDTTTSSPRTANQEKQIGYYPSVDRLMALSEDDLNRVDPLIVNLAVARGILEFSQLDIERFAQTLDTWAAEIKLDTERHWYRFAEHHEQFKNSEIEYKITWLASDINAVFKVDYDLSDFDAANPSNLFLNGLIDRKVGTCVSMPMLYVALGWRLGYPIKLVSVPTHLFARWDDGEHRVNIEATGYGADLTDDFYEQEYFVPVEWKGHGALASLTPRQGLAQMLLARADYWARQGDTTRQVADALRANLLHPEHPLAITELERAWSRRAEQNEYFANAVSQLLAAGQRIRERELGNAGKPIEKLIFTENGPLNVLVDPKTGKQTSTEELP